MCQMSNHSESLMMYHDPSPNASNFPVVKTTLPHPTDRSTDLTRFTHAREKLALTIFTMDKIYCCVAYSIWSKRHENLAIFFIECTKYTVYAQPPFQVLCNDKYYRQYYATLLSHDHKHDSQSGASCDFGNIGAYFSF